MPSRKLRRGAMLPLIAMLLPVMLILASFVVNVAYMELTRTELRIASDAATRAAGHAFMSTGDQAAARDAAREGARRNPVAGRQTQLANNDVVFGVARRTATNQRYKFAAGGAKANAVSVNARRDVGSLSGSIAMVMPSFGAAKQFSPSQSAISTQVELDVALVLDRSGSMAYGAAEDSGGRAAAGLPPAIAPAGWQFCDPAPAGSRWLDLVGGVNIFLGELQKSPQQEYLSLATYGDSSSLEAPLGKSQGPITKGMNKYTKNYCSGLTNIQAGITEGINAVGNPSKGRPWAVKVIVLMTDGRRTAGGDPKDAARDANAQGITVYTVTFSDEADQASMKSVAEIGGGKHFHATSASELRTAFLEIAKRLPTLLTQ